MESVTKIASYVCSRYRTLYKQNGLDETLSSVVIEQYKEVFDYVFSVYAGKRSFVLSNITYGEYSWRHAREGYSKYADSKEPMLQKEFFDNFNSEY